MPATFRRLNRKVIDENGEEKFELLATVGVDDTELDIMKGATVDIDGVFGLVPTPPKGELNRYLRVDGTWAEPAGDLPSAGSGSSGLMTPDQVKDLQECVTNITNLTNSLTQTNKNVTNLSNTVTQLSQKHSNDINSINGSISSINGSISTMRKDVELNKALIIEINQMIQAIQDQIRELGDRVGAIEVGIGV